MHIKAPTSLSQDLSNLGKLLFGHNWLADWARKLFKPSTDLASRLIEIEKKSFFVLGLGFSVGDVVMGACFRLFGHVYLALGANPASHVLAKLSKI